MDYTHVEDVEDPIEIPSPSGNCIFVVPGMEASRDRVTFSLCDNLPLDLPHGSVITTVVSRLLLAQTIGGPTHDVSCPIASRTEPLSSSDRLPFNPRSRA